MSGLRFTKAKAPWVGLTGGVSWPDPVAVSALFTAQTTDDTLTTLGTIALDATSGYIIEGYIQGIKSTGFTDYVSARFTAIFQRNGGVSRLAPLSMQGYYLTDPEMYIDCIASGTNAIFQVKGLVGSTINWTGFALTFKQAV